MGLWRRLAFSLLLLLLLRGLGQSPWVAAAALAVRWLLGDPACGALLSLAVLAGPWLGPWTPHWLSLAAAALLLTLLPARPPPELLWLPADLAYTFLMLRLGLRTWARLRRRPPDTFVDTFERHARAQPDRTILVCTGPGGRAVTFRELDASACQAAWALKAELAGTAGLCTREPTALLVLPSQTLPALSLWLGLAKLGCPVVWINPHGRGPPLVHAVLSSGARVLVVDPGENPWTRELEGLGSRRERAAEDCCPGGPSGGWLLAHSLLALRAQTQLLDRNAEGTRVLLFFFTMAICGRFAPQYPLQVRQVCFTDAGGASAHFAPPTAGASPHHHPEASSDPSRRASGKPGGGPAQAAGGEGALPLPGPKLPHARGGGPGRRPGCGPLRPRAR